MRTSTIILIIVAVIIVVIAALFWIGANNQNMATQSGIYPTSSAGPASNTAGGPTPAVPGTPGSTSLATLTLNVSSSPKLGNYLVAANGMTLYRFTPDKGTTSTCTGQCAALWPPYTITDTSTLSGALAVSGTLGTTQRADGSLQLTYNGHPLYYYSKDSKPGDTNGQGIGGIWFVVKP